MYLSCGYCQYWSSVPFGMTTLLDSYTNMWTTISICGMANIPQQHFFFFFAWNNIKDFTCNTFILEKPTYSTKLLK